MTLIALRFQVARKLGMKLVGTIGGFPLFNGTPEQFEEFHRLVQPAERQAEPAWNV